MDENANAAENRGRTTASKDVKTREIEGEIVDTRRRVIVGM